MTPQDRAELFIKRLVKSLSESEGEKVPSEKPPSLKRSKEVNRKYNRQKNKLGRVRSIPSYKRTDIQNRPYRQTRKPFMYDDPDPNEY